MKSHIINFLKYPIVIKPPQGRYSCQKIANPSIQKTGYQLSKASNSHNPYPCIKSFFHHPAWQNNPKSLTHADVMQLQRTIRNSAVGRLLSDIGYSIDQQEYLRNLGAREASGEIISPLRIKFGT
jgi:hypothetical protein